MNGEAILSLISLGVSLLLGLLVFITNRGANRTNEKKVELEEKMAEDDRDDQIAERRRIELERLYHRLDKLEESDRKKTTQIEKLQVEVKHLRIERDLLFNHVEVLEAGYPNPPGPPPRPRIRPLVTS